MRAQDDFVSITGQLLFKTLNPFKSMSVMLLKEVHPSLTFYFSVKSLTAAGKFKNRRYRENNQKKTVSPISETLLNTSYDCGHYLRAARSHYFHCHCSWLSPPSLPGLTAHRQRRTYD